MDFQHPVLLENFTSMLRTLLLRTTKMYFNLNRHLTFTKPLNYCCCLFCTGQVIMRLYVKKLTMLHYTLLLKNYGIILKICLWLLLL